MILNFVLTNILFVHVILNYSSIKFVLNIYFLSTILKLYGTLQ